MKILIRIEFSEQVYSRNSQAPGPVGKTVSIPLRKSGIPVEVETPAPYFKKIENINLKVTKNIYQ